MFPDLSDETLLAFDIETRDPGLKTLGPGPRRGAEIIGVSIATKDREWYFPTAGKAAGFYQPSLLDEPSQESRYAISTVAQWMSSLKNKQWIAANCLYDLDFLQYHGFRPDTVWDIQWLEALLNENRLVYNLDSLSEQYLEMHKGEDKLAAFCLDNGLKGAPQEHLSKMPVGLVAEYAKKDVRLTYDIFEKQKPRILEENLQDVAHLEHSLIPFYLSLRHDGINLNTRGLEAAREELDLLYQKTEKELYKSAGPLNINSSQALATLARKKSIKLQYTAKGAVSFTKAVFDDIQDSDFDKIRELREIEKISGTFLDGLSRFQIDGKLYPLFHPLRGDAGGTVTGRLSSSMPNLQNQPERNEKAKKLIRGLFLPRLGELWYKTDYSQIEYRLFAHFAVGDGAEELRRRFREDADFDPHQITADGLADLGFPIGRKKSKNVNFGTIYGMGVKKLAAQLVMEESAAYSVMDAYHRASPHMRATMQKYIQESTENGYVTTVSGRRGRILDQNYAYKALNKLIQGSAADVMKKALLDCMKKGLFNVVTPLVTVHDELDYSAPATPEGLEAVREIIHTMETTIEFSVPLKTETTRGKTWADATEVFT